MNKLGPPFGMRIILSMILAAPFLAYWPSLGNGFVNWDDNLYVLDNPVIRSLSLDNFQQIISSFFAGNYQPLTILSYAVDHHFFGMNPLGYHATNLIFHLGNTLLVLGLMRALGARTPVAGAVALLFGIHPLHVESVAWISERKDVLYAFFFLGSLICYCRYLKSDFKRKFYYAALVLFFFSLLSKAMAVSLPLVLLLIDYFVSRTNTKNALLEKIPFFALALFFGTLAYVAQMLTGAVRQQEMYHALDKILVVPFAVAFYVVKIILPVKLSCLYPYFVIRGEPLFFLGLVAGLVATALVILFSWRRSRVVVFSVLFFLLTIAPVLQVVPIGQALVADRYVYIPCIGLFYGLCEGVFGLTAPKAHRVSNVAVIPILSFAALAVVALGILTWNRCRVWKDSETLWSDVLARYPRSSTAHNNLGAILAERGRRQEAAVLFQKAIGIDPSYSAAYNNLGMIYRDAGRDALALAFFTKATQIDPRFGGAYRNLCRSAARLGSAQEAVAACQRAIMIDPGHPQPYGDLGVLYARSGRAQEALGLLKGALERDPDNPAAYNNLGVLNILLGNRQEAATLFKRALDIEPGYTAARDNLDLCDAPGAAPATAGEGKGAADRHG